ncbi:MULTISPECIES: hypothetical protein [unclassified Streptomyces]|uniref:hypothetical protein n=1 Tax=unclassified Streptomyces TaxID=2593676 RepID=UPI0036EDB38D
MPGLPPKTTVSRALNGKGEISEDTVVKVRKAVTEDSGLRMQTVNRGEESLRTLGLWVAAKWFDGLLVIEPEGALGAITELHEAGLPVVLVDDRFQRPGFPYVATTNRGSGEQAARHLLDLGRRRPLVVNGPDECGCTRERLRGPRPCRGGACAAGDAGTRAGPAPT